MSGPGVGGDGAGCEEITNGVRRKFLACFEKNITTNLDMGKHM